MYLFRPQLLESLADYSRAKFMKDLVAGVIVAIIALPLSIALALASGVSPEQGLYTAIVAGFLISALGGSKVQIAGPTAAFASIVAGIVARNGMDGLAVATVLAGILLILMGVLRMGSMIKFIPYTITTGFTAGIAVTIVVGQLKDFFGVTFQNSPVETVEKLEKVFCVLFYLERKCCGGGMCGAGHSDRLAQIFCQNPCLAGGSDRHGGHGQAAAPAGEHHRGSIYHFHRSAPIYSAHGQL